MVFLVDAGVPVKISISSVNLLERAERAENIHYHSVNKKASQKLFKTETDRHPKKSVVQILEYEAQSDSRVAVNYVTPSLYCSKTCQLSTVNCQPTQQQPILPSY